MRNLIKTKMFSATLLCLSLTSCGIFHPYTPTFTQGNIITSDALAQIHVGMPVSQVLAIMGSPVLIDTFSDNRFDYVYQTVKRQQIIQSQKAIISISNGVVSNITVQ